MTSSIPSLSFVLLALAASASAQTYYVDPQSGSNSNSGSAAAPFATMSYAASQASPGVSLTINLMPGVYSANSGEVFPVTLPGDCVLQGVQPFGVRIDHSLPPSVVAQATPAIAVTAVSGAPRAEIRNLRITGNQQGILMQSVGAQGATFCVDNVETRMTLSSYQNSGVGIQVFNDDSHLVTFFAEDCRNSDASIGMWIRSNFDQVYAVVERCSSDMPATVLPSGTGYRIDGTNGGRVDMGVVTSTVTHRLRGFESQMIGGSLGDLTLRHCAVHDCGIQSFVFPSGLTIEGGGISETAGSLLRCTVQGSAFYGNQADMPNYTAGTYGVVESLVQDPALVALGNLTGDPKWVDASNGDFHLRPGSPCRDQVTYTTPSQVPSCNGMGGLVDLDGDDRLSACANAVDIGPDESFDADIYVRGGLDAAINTTLSIYVYGDGGSIGLVVGGPAYAPCSLPANLAAYTLLIPPFMMPGTPGTRDYQQTSLAVPNDPALVGQTAQVSSAFLTSAGGLPGLQVAANYRAIQIWQ